MARMSVAENLDFREFDRATLEIERYMIKIRSVDTPIGELSGGNVQQTVLARELGGEVNIMIQQTHVLDSTLPR